MKAKNYIVFLLGIVVLGLGVAWSVVPASGHGDGERKERCALAGTWIGTLGEATIRLTAIPQDPANRRVSLLYQNVTEDPNFGGLVNQILGSPVTSRTDFRGEAVRTGPRTFDYTRVAHAINENKVSVGFPPQFKVVYIELVSGTIEFTDCDTIEMSLTAAFFSADQDPFGEEPPIVCSGPGGAFPGPFVSTLRRMHPVPPCEP
ncbi:MAG: hypothetical protein HY717_08215 [Planctomycetes bacterium]|nr:hypothetical protein [Planctomycetota bacterium]